MSSTDKEKGRRKPALFTNNQPRTANYGIVRRNT
jgi:hypothetical protein